MTKDKFSIIDSGGGTLVKPPLRAGVGAVAPLPAAFPTPVEEPSPRENQERRVHAPRPADADAQPPALEISQAPDEAHDAHATPRSAANDGAAPEQERRAHRRMRVLQRALIVFNNRLSTIECRVRDISDGGCRLRMGAPLTLPDRFIVHFVKTREERLAELTWRSDNELGVRFID